MMEIASKDALSTWKIMLEHVVRHGNRIHYRNRGVIECRNIMTVIQETTRGIDAPMVALNSLGKWPYPSLEEISESVLSPNAELDYGYTYGQRLFGSNQIDGYLIPLLKTKPLSGRCVAMAWDIQRDAKLEAAEVPGIVLFDFKIRNGELHTTVIIRNNDIFFGWPANLYQTYVLQRYVAKKLGVKQGTITTLSCSAHIYENVLPYIKKIVGTKQDPK